MRFVANLQGTIFLRKFATELQAFLICEGYVSVAILLQIAICNGIARVSFFTRDMFFVVEVLVIEHGHDIYKQ